MPSPSRPWTGHHLNGRCRAGHPARSVISQVTSGCAWSIKKHLRLTPCQSQDIRRYLAKQKDSGTCHYHEFCAHAGMPRALFMLRATSLIPHFWSWKLLARRTLLLKFPHRTTCLSARVVARGDAVSMSTGRPQCGIRHRPIAASAGVSTYLHHYRRLKFSTWRGHGH